MTETIHVLLLEDNESDAEMIMHRLRRSAMRFDITHVADRDSYLQYLSSSEPDLILSDYNIPGYDPVAALEHCREKHPFIPFILVTGTMNGEEAVELITTHGINDYIIKSNLERLAPTVVREYKYGVMRQDMYRASLVGEHTSNLVMITGADGEIEWVNASVSEVSGYTAEEIKGKQVREVFWDGMNEWAGDHQIWTPDLGHYSAEVLAKHKSGSLYWIKLDVTPVKRGEILQQYIVVAEVISKRKEAELELELSNKRLKDAQKVGQIGDFRFSLTDESIEWSEEIYRIFERDGSLSPPSYDEIRNKYFGEDSEKHNSMVDEAIRSANKYDAEFRINTDSGSHKIVRVVGIPTSDHTGKVTEIRGIVQDITATKMAEKELKEQTLTLKSISDNIEGMLLRYALYPDGTDDMLYISEGAEEVTEISKQELEEDVSKMWAMILEEDVPGMQQSIMRSAETLEEWDHTWRIRTPSGELRYIHGMGKPFRRKDGAVIWDSILLNETETIKLREALIDNELRLEAAIKGADLGVWDFYLNSNDHYVNARFWQMLGYEPGEMEYSYENFLSLLHPDDRDKPNQEIERIQNGGENLVDIIIRMRAKNGEYRTILDRGRVVKFSEDGEIIRMVGTHLDITELLKTKEDLLQYQKFTEIAVEGAEVGLWEVDLKTYETFYNDTYYTMLGYEAKDVVYNKSFHDKLIHPDDDLVIEGYMEEILTGKRESFEATIRMKHKEGHYVWVLDRAKVVEFTEDGKPKKLAGSHLNIDKRVRTENLLRQANDTLRALIDASPLAIYQIDMDGKVVDFWNEAAEEIFGYTRDEVMFRRIPHVHGPHVDEFTKVMETIRSGEEITQLRLKRKRKDGSDIIIEISTGTISLENNTKRNALVIASDVTELVKKENQLRGSLHEKTVLIEEIHHRVKNNLAIVSSMLELQNISGEKNEQLTHAVNRIKSIAIVHEQLYNSESLTDIDLEQYYHELTATILKTLAVSSRVSFDLSVDVDRININQAVPMGLLLNELMTNSLKYAFDGSEEGYINVNIGQNGNGELNFSYRDNGRGFDYEESLRKGGFGLELINTLLEQLNADYSIDSDKGYTLKCSFKPRSLGSQSNL